MEGLTFFAKFITLQFRELIFLRETTDASVKLNRGNFFSSKLVHLSCFTKNLYYKKETSIPYLLLHLSNSTTQVKQLRKVQKATSTLNKKCSKQVTYLCLDGSSNQTLIKVYPHPANLKPGTKNKSMTFLKKPILTRVSKKLDNETGAKYFQNRLTLSGLILAKVFS